MAKSRDSTPPGDPLPDPYPDEFEDEEKDAFVKSINKRIAWMKSHWILSIVGGLLFLGVLVMIVFGLIHWATGITTLMFVRLGMHFFKPSVRSRTFNYLAKHRVKAGFIVLFALTLPILAPMLLTTYGGLYFRDWDRQMDPPKIYYVWIVDDTAFNKEDQKRLSRLNPGGEKSESIEGLILLAAASVNLEGDKLVPFERTNLNNGEPFSVIVFESEQEEVMVPVTPKEGEPIPETPAMQKQMVSYVTLYFITPVTDENGEVKTKEKDGKKKAIFKMVPYRLPPTLNVSFGMLAQGFSDATGREIDLADLKVFLQKKKEEQRQRKTPIVEDGAIIDGTRG